MVLTSVGGSTVISPGLKPLEVGVELSGSVFSGIPVTPETVSSGFSEWQLARKTTQLINPAILNMYSIFCNFIMVRKCLDFLF
jgi:hypothetical protein